MTVEKSFLRFIPFHAPLIEDEEIEEVISVLKSGWLTTGPKTEQFEREFAHYIGANYAISVNSGTAGLHLALVALNIGPNDEVITTPYTFAATSEVILYCNARPVFVDIDETSFNIDAEKIEKFISPRTRAILPVHIAGHPCDMERIMQIAEAHKLFVIEDAAHSLEASINGKKIGTIGHITAFSFYATKNITTGEGGMITTNDSAWADKLKILRLHGLTHQAWNRYCAQGSWYYEIVERGYKYNMTDILAAIGIKQLAKVERFSKIRKTYVQMYQSAFQEVPELIIPTQKEGINHAWHLYLLRLRLDQLTISRNQFIEKLREANIGTSVHFIPLHLHPYYQKTFGYQYGDFPVAERVYESVVSLPLYPRMREDEVEYVIKKVIEIVKSSKRRIWC